MNNDCLQLDADEYQLLQLAGSNLTAGVRLAGKHVRLLSLATLLGCEFIDFEEGRLVIAPRGQRFLHHCDAHPDGTASIPHDKLPRTSFKPWKLDGQAEHG